MYNLASILESILDKLDVMKFNDLLDLKAAASGMMALNSSGAWKKTGRSEGKKGGGMDSIPEEDDADSSWGKTGRSESEDEDLGVFDSDNIRAALRRMNYQVAYVAFGVCAPSIT